jgi:photosystem II stability/assembly factor-like uncharacterized protein
VTNSQDDPRGAVRYFYDLRAYPLTRIPPQARAKAMAEMQSRWPTAFSARTARALGVPTSNTAWTPLGPSPIATGVSTFSGRANAVAVHPTQPNTIYIGGAQGGVWKTTDGGVTWTALTDAACSLAMGAIAIDPVNPQIVYAGTGEQNFSGDSYYGCGVLRSTDGGASWAQLGASNFDTPTGGATISRLIVDRATAGTTGATKILAATSFGVFRSLNSGGAWTNVLSGVATDLVVDPTTPGTLYAAVGGTTSQQTTGIYKSLDTGTTWTRLGGGLPSAPVSNVGRTSLALAPSAPQRLYAAIQNGDPATFGFLLGMWTTGDGGATWTKTIAATASCSSQCWYDQALTVDPTTPTTVYFGGVSLFKSVDGGASFVDIFSSPLHVDQHALVFAASAGGPPALYVASDGGVFRSLDAGVSFASLNTGLTLTQFYTGISMDPASATSLLGGTQDNGTVLWSGLASWPEVLGGDGGFTAIDPTAPGTAFGETQWSTGSVGGGPRRRDAVNGPFLLRTTGISISDRAAFIPPIVMDPVRPRILWFGTNRLYRTGNRGDAWIAMSPDLTRGTAAINTIGVPPSDSTTVYVGTTDANLQYTHDFGTTWTLAGGLPNAVVSDIKVDPHDARIAYATFHGFATTKVVKTTDGGVTWTNLTFNLPNIPVLSLVIEPGSHDVDIGTDLGVFTLRDGTAAWVPIVNGLPNVAVYDLLLDVTRSRLIAATHGRGMFSLDITLKGLRGDITNDGTLGAVDAQAILAAVVGLSLPANSIRFPNGDANCDGDVTAADALVVLSKVVGLSVGSACVGTIK